MYVNFRKQENDKANMAEYFASLSGKVALITGASSGIGAATAEEFAKHGMKLVLHGRNQERLNKTVEKCKAAGSQDVKCVIGDIGDEESVSKFGEAAIKSFGTVNILVNNAGGAAGGNLDNTSLEDMDAMYKQHVRAPFQLIKILQAELVKNKGHIVNVGSWLGECQMTNLFALGVAFASTKQLTNMTAMALARRGVRCNTICPGLTRTPALATAGHVGTAEESYKAFESMAKFTGLNEVSSPEEIARSILFLVSDMAPRMTGEALLVDGGASKAVLASSAQWLSE